MGNERQSGTQPVYRVEVRVNKHFNPVQVGNRMIGHEWVRLPTVDTFPYGTSHRSDLLSYVNVHNYHGAIALAASVLSADHYGTRLEARIIRLKLKYEWELERVEEIAVPTAFDVMFAMARKLDATDEEKQ